MDDFFEVFTPKPEGKEEVDQTIQNDTRLKHQEKYERLGLQQFRKDHLKQYLYYLRGLQLE